jgi:hypothetical protein
MRRLPTALLLVVGVLTAQAAWLLAVPAFRGLDEFDHVYRAASVARGQWMPSGRAAAHGRGELVSVPRDLVAAAGPECRARPYTGHDNCNPADGAAGDQVEVATAASRYQPAFYWVVGSAARWAHGTAADYVMRVVSALLCALLTGTAVGAVGLWARTRWPVLALAGSLTPVVMYSSVVAAPNALEIAAATSLWAALVGLAAEGLAARTERRLLWAAVPGAVLLANLRSLGIGFLALTVVVVAAILGRRRLAELAARQTRTLVATGSLVAAAVGAGAWWLVAAAPNRLEEHGGYTGAVAATLVELPVWVLQTIGAAPGRSDPAPPSVYLLCGGLVAALMTTALRCAERRLRLAVMAMAAACLVGPVLFTLHTYRDVGVVWQGRYEMPFGVGMLLLAGLALDRTTRFPGRAPVALALAGFATGQLVAVLHVLSGQRAVSPSVALGLWTPPGPWAVAALTLGGWALVGVGVLRRNGSSVSESAAGRRGNPRGSAGILPRLGGDFPAARRGISRGWSGAAGGVALDELAGELLEEEPHVGHDAARL